MAFATAEAATAAGATGAAVGVGLFSYNRGNYLYDAEFRYERFTTGREYANQQTEQYRNDIRAMAGYYMKKNALWCTTASLTMALCVACYCAGRLGLHGPSPPAWLIGLWYTNTATAFGYMALAIWLSMHAGFRAQAAAVHMLTRKTRLPIPTLKQLDRARKFASEFEQQNWSDIFRVPYLQNNGAPKTDSDAFAQPKETGRARSAPPGSRGRARPSSWVREEFREDHNAGAAGVVSGPKLAVEGGEADALPEHFSQFAAVQESFYKYDVYARVCLFYGFVSFINGCHYYGLGQINIELRAFWVAFATIFILAVLHVLLLRFDIIPQSERRSKKEYLPHCEWLGPLAALPGSIACALDFRVQYDPTAIAFCWILIFVTYIMQFVYACRMLELLLPDEIGMCEGDDTIGHIWYPKTWKVPSSFHHVIYQVVPPTFLRAGQYDIVREVKHGGGGAAPEVMGNTNMVDRMQGMVEYLDNFFRWCMTGGEQDMTEQGKVAVKELHAELQNARSLAGTEGLNAVQKVMCAVQTLAEKEQVAMGGFDSAGESESEKKDARKFHKAAPAWASSKHVEPWKLVAGIQLVYTSTWIFLILGNVIDVAVGEQGLITAPHWSRPPMTRLSLEPHELGTPLGFPWPAGDKPYIPEQMAWHEEKREYGQTTMGRRLDAREGFDASGLKHALSDLLSKMTRDSTPAAAPESIAWPNFFEPKMLACGPAGSDGLSSVAALTPRGFGAVARVGGGAAAADAVKLSGLMHLPPLMSASWGPKEEDGLLLVSREGHLASCPGPRPAVGGTWRCGNMATHMPQKLPCAGRKLLAAASAMLHGLGGAGGEPRLHAAFVEESAPELVALFVHEAESWLPLGEIPLPRGQSGRAGAKASLAFVGGSDLLITTEDGAVLRKRLHDGAVVASATHAVPATWQAACGVHHGAGNRVAHLQLGNAHRPEVMIIEAAPAVYQ